MLSCFRRSQEGEIKTPDIKQADEADGCNESYSSCTLAFDDHVDGHRLLRYSLQASYQFMVLPFLES